MKSQPRNPDLYRQINSTPQLAHLVSPAINIQKWCVQRKDGMDFLQLLNASDIVLGWVTEIIIDDNFDTVEPNISCDFKCLLGWEVVEAAGRHYQLHGT